MNSMFVDVATSTFAQPHVQLTRWRLTNQNQLARNATNTDPVHLDRSSSLLLARPSSLLQGSRRSFLCAAQRPRRPPGWPALENPIAFAAQSALGPFGVGLGARVGGADRTHRDFHDAADHDVLHGAGPGPASASGNDSGIAEVPRHGRGVLPETRRPEAACEATATVDAVD